MCPRDVCFRTAYPKPFFLDFFLLGVFFLSVDGMPNIFKACKEKGGSIIFEDSIVNFENVKTYLNQFKTEPIFEYARCVLNNIYSQ